MQRCFVLSFILWLLCVTAVQGTLYLSCEQGNDLYQVLVDNDIPCRMAGFAIMLHAETILKS